MGVHKITSNGESIVVPDDLVLIRDTFFSKSLKPLIEWSLRVLEEQELDPQNRDHRRMIFLRAEYRDWLAAVDNFPKTLHTSSIVYLTRHYGTLDGNS